MRKLVRSQHTTGKSIDTLRKSDYEPYRDYATNGLDIR